MPEAERPSEARASVRRDGSPRERTPDGLDLRPRSLGIYGLVGLLLSLGVGGVLLLVAPMPAGDAAPAASSTPIHHVNLTIGLNSSTGWPQYSPSNFSVPAGVVVFRITDNDQQMNWSGCPCPVRGTIGGQEYINGTPTGVVPPSNVAHAFVAAALGLYVYSPGQSTVQFSADLFAPGNFTWLCIIPCGAGTDPANTAPMGSPGYMAGTITVTQ